MMDNAGEVEEQSERAEERDEQAALERMPPWVPTYLAAWGSTIGPDGKRMKVQTAAGLAGTTASNVRDLRRRSDRFRRMEYMARHGAAEFAASFVEAGLRGVAPVIFERFMQLVDSLDGPTIRQAMAWLRGKPVELDLALHGTPDGDPILIHVDE